MGRGARAGGCGLECRTDHSQATLQGSDELLHNHAYCVTPEMHEVIKSGISELAKSKVDALAWTLHKGRFYLLSSPTNFNMKITWNNTWFVRTSMVQVGISLGTLNILTTLIPVGPTVFGDVTFAQEMVHYQTWTCTKA
jgi:hypothetical protein